MIYNYLYQFILNLREDTMENIAVRFDHVSMEFPGVLANDDISLEIRKGRFLLWWEKTGQESPRS